MNQAKKIGKQSSEVADQTKLDILTAALDCFANDGFNSTSLRDIASKANSTHGLIRHHFGSKESLWKACVSSALNQLSELQSPVLVQVTPENAVESIKELLRTLVYSAAHHPNIWRLVTFESLKNSERLDYLLLDTLRPVYDKFTPLFNIVKSQGHFQEFDHESFVLFIISLCAIPFAITPFCNKIYDTESLSEERIKKHADLVISTLFPEPDKA